MYTGRCLCGQVNFSIQQKIHTIYHCHCSLCRKQSGTGTNAATLVLQQNFNWESAKNTLHTYKMDSGFTSSFLLNVDPLYLIKWEKRIICGFL